MLGDFTLIKVAAERVYLSIRYSDSIFDLVQSSFQFNHFLFNSVGKVMGKVL